MTDNSPAGASAGRRTHPLIIVAAAAVTLFCLVGIGVMTGLVPGAQSGTVAKPDAVAATNNAPGTVQPAIASSGENVAPLQAAANPNSAPSEPLAPIKSEILGQPNAKTEVKPSANQLPVANPGPAPSSLVASNLTNNSPTPVYATQSDNRGSVNASAQYAPDGPAPLTNIPAPPPVCQQCGTVEQITPLQKQGQGSGAGAVLGGLLGGVVGHQVGGGRGRDVATVAGAVGGALIGNQVEKSSNSTTEFEVRVRMENGSYRSAKFASEPGMRIGDKVRFENGRLLRR
jgi:outer membrane lipoprotein SlyB